MKQKDRIKTVALYIRVSTDRQAKEGDSLEAQEKALTDYAKKNKYKIYDTYIDGGESGQKLKRTNLQRMLKDLETGHIDLILMTKLDRWFRNIADFYKVIEILKKNNVAWKTIWEDYDTTTASGEFWLNMSLSLGQMEAKRTGERIISVFDHKFRVQKTVCSGKVPYGYKISDDKKIIIDPETAPHIQGLFDQYLLTNNLSKTVRWFQENCSQKSYDSIKIYLKNTAYIGRYVRKSTGEVLEDFCPQIVEDDVFYRVQELFKHNIKEIKHKNTDPYIFSRLIKCGQCGRKMAGRYASKNNTHYYRCKRANESNYCSNKYNVPEKRIEEFVIKNIFTQFEQKKLKIDEVNQKEKKINIDSIKRKMNKLSELYLNDMIDIDFYTDQYSSLKKILEENEKNKDIDKTKSNLKKIQKYLSSDIFKTYDKLNNQEKRELWGSIIESIEIKSKNEFEINFLM